jgi:general secretion pathway protein D
MMGFVMRLLAIPLSLLLGLQAVSGATTTAESARPHDSTNVQYRHRVRPRAIRHGRETTYVARRETRRQIASKNTDGAIAKTEAPPTQVLVEAMIVEVMLAKDFADLGVNSALFGGTATRPASAVDGASISVAAGSNPASVIAAHGEPARMLAGEPNGIKSAGWLRGSAVEFLRTLESIGETTVLASPRILTINKHPADVQIGNELGYRTRNLEDGTCREHFIPIGTRLRVRPLVAADGRIRLEVHAERSTGHLDAMGIPQVNSAQVSTNVMMPDGATFAICFRPREEVEQSSGPFSLLSWIPYSDRLFPSREYAAKKQLILFLTSRIFKQ